MGQRWPSTRSKRWTWSNPWSTKRCAWTLRFHSSTVEPERTSGWVRTTRSSTSRRASCCAAFRSSSWGTPLYSTNRTGSSRTGSPKRKGPSCWTTCIGPMGLRPGRPVCPINSARVRTLSHSPRLWLWRTFFAGMIPSKGMAVPSLPFKRPSERRVNVYFHCGACILSKVYYLLENDDLFI